MRDAEVAIIGGGVHGASAAFHLAERGVDTVLFERGEAAGGPTGRSSAVCRAYYTNPFLARVARESLDMLAELAARTGDGDGGFCRTGALFVHGPADVDGVGAATARMRAVGTDVDVLTPDALRKRFPRFRADDIGCAVHEPGAGYADPVETTRSLLAGARRSGADIRLHTPVEQLSFRPPAGAVLELAGGERCVVDRLLIAAGPWTGRLAARLDVELPLRVERHVVATARWGDAEPVGHAFADVPGGYYARPDAGDTLLVGPLTPEPPIDDPDSFDERITDVEALGLIASVVARIPSLDGLTPRGGWASLYDVSPDWQPVIGRIAPGVFVDAGTSGHGFKLAPGLGRYTAGMVLDEPDPDLALFTPERFASDGALGAGFGAARILG